MQQQSNGQNNFLIDADIGDDDVTLPSLPAVNVPSIETPKERFYRQELEQFRRIFHKPVIYAAWDWENTVSDALFQSGFKSFEEQANALAEQRKKKW